MFSFEWLRRAVTRRGLRRVIRYAWSHRDSFDGKAFSFCGSFLNYMCMSLRMAFTDCGFYPSVTLGLFGHGLYGRKPLFEVLLPEFGIRVEDFKGRNDGSGSDGSWWNPYSGYGGRADYLRWLCSCYGIDLDAYVKRLSNS